MTIKYIFIGWGNWPERRGTLDLDMVEYMDMLRATDADRDAMCEKCRCFEKYSKCRQVQVTCIDVPRAYNNVCPILFFDRIGIRLDEIVLDQEEDQDKEIA
jgi:hypothetical protein